MKYFPIANFRWIALWLLSVPLAIAPVKLTHTQTQPNAASRALTVRSDIQEADARTGIVTARGNVEINYPARNLQATSDQAQYFSRERRLVLNGNVYILQQGNSIRGETVTYQLEEGIFIATPRSGDRVESIYLLPETESGTTANNPAPPILPDFQPQEQ